MTAQAVHTGSYPAPRRAGPASVADWFSRASVATLVFSSGFVFIEPAPHELLAALIVPLFFINGLKLPSGLSLAAFLMVLYCIGGFAGGIIAPLTTKAMMHALITSFLVVMAIFIAAYVAGDIQRRMRAVCNAYMAAATVGSIIAILGYFRLLPNSDWFLLYERATGPFKDPNVLGSFMIFGSTIAIQRVLTCKGRDMIGACFALVVISLAVFLSMSRAAWGLLVLCGAMIAFFSFVTAESRSTRTRILVMLMIGLFVVVIAIIGLLSIDKVQQLFKARASLNQSYDMGQYGRINRHWIGFGMAMEYPLGIGFMEFTRLFGEEPHNIYLQGFMSYGWLGGISYAALVFVSIRRGYRALRAKRPWRPLLASAYVTFVGLSLEGWIIDTDHWRHWWLTLGLTWAGIVVEKRLKSEELKKNNALFPASNDIKMQSSLAHRAGPDYVSRHVGV